MLFYDRSLVGWYIKCSFMFSIIKKIISSKIFKLIFSAVLIYFAFSKVGFSKVLVELAQVPIWFVLAMVLYYGMATFVGSFRWISLLFDRPSLRQTWDFTKASYIGAFYGLFLPVGMAGDLFKWLPLQKKYKEIKKARMWSSILLDRIVGFTAFILVAFISSLIGLKMGINFPHYLIYVFGALFLGTVLFYVLVYSFDVVAFVERIPVVKKIVPLMDLLKKENKKRLFKCLVIALVTEFAWFTPIWFISLILGAGMSLVSIYIIIPIVSLVLLLPISIAGFGAREQLFLFFFVQMGLDPSKVLAVSTLNGIFMIINSLMGGVFTLF